MMDPWQSWLSLTWNNLELAESVLSGESDQVPDFPAPPPGSFPAALAAEIAAVRARADHVAASLAAGSAAISADMADRARWEQDKPDRPEVVL